MVSSNFLTIKMFGQTPRWSQRVIYWGVLLFWTAGSYRNSGPGSKTENPFRPKSFFPKLRNFVTFCVLADRTPTSGKSQNTGFLGTFGLGQPLDP